MKKNKPIRLKMKIRKGNTVKVMAGKDKGKTGKVEKVLPKVAAVLVEGVNKYKKHLKPQGEGKPGGIVEISKPLPVANVVLLCPKCQKPTRVGYQTDRSNKKYRICKKCKEAI